MDNKLIIDVLFNRSATKPTIPNKLAKIKDYLAINCKFYYNSVLFIGGQNVDNQNQSVSRFEITLDPDRECKENVLLQFNKTFKDHKILY